MNFALENPVNQRLCVEDCISKKNRADFILPARIKMLRKISCVRTFKIGLHYAGPYAYAGDFSQKASRNKHSASCLLLDLLFHTFS